MGVVRHRLIMNGHKETMNGAKIDSHKETVGSEWLFRENLWLEDKQ